MTEIDPLTLLHDEFERFLAATPCVKTALNVAMNIVAFNKLHGTERYDTNTNRDVPEILLEETGGISNLNFASNAVSWDWSYNAVINTGDTRVTKSLNPVVFALFAALKKAVESSTLTGLKWRGKMFCKNISMSQTQVGQSDPQLNRGIKGWTSIATVTFHLIFDRQDILNYADGVAS